MLKLNFTVNEEYLLAHTLASREDASFSSKEHREDIVALQNKAQDISQGGYAFLTAELVLPGALLDISLLDLGRGARFAQQLAKKIQSIEEYRRILDQTLQYKGEVETQWATTLPRTLAIMQEMTGLEYDEEFTVYITHPSLRNGRYLGRKRIEWGHNEDFPHYAVVYLWHEIMHDKLPGDDLGHSTIELATDEELRVRLNGGTYPPFVGRKKLESTKQQVLQDWRAYLALPRKDIHTFYDTMRERQ